MRTLTMIREELTARVERLNSQFERGEGRLELAIKPQDFLTITGTNCPEPLQRKRQLAIENPLATHVVVTLAEAEGLLVATAVAATADIKGDGGQGEE